MIRLDNRADIPILRDKCVTPVSDDWRRAAVQPRTRCVMTRHRFAVLLLPLFAVIACGAGTAAAQPAPLDPLSSEEKAIAERLVRADPRARDLLGAASHAGVDRVPGDEGPGRGRAPCGTRTCCSRVRTPTSARRAIVRLGAAPSIVELTRVDRKSVPMTEADVQEAWRIAARGPRLQKAPEP